MPEPDFSAKRGDTASYIYATLEDAAGDAVDIAGASVRFKMGPLSGGTLTVAADATIALVGAGRADGTTGQVIYRWATGDLATADWYRAEWEVTYSNGTIQTFPNTGPMIVAVAEDL
jgi:hypothetical protein